MDARATVPLPDGSPEHPIRFNPKAFQSFDHGYAVTIHKSQGATVDQAYILASRSMDNHLAYVAMTRHREDMQLFINERDCPKWGVEQEQIRYPVEERHRFSGPSMG
jgi:ATP-dependent exoDNAse (exonuclease V) alpha subunit